MIALLPAMASIPELKTVPKVDFQRYLGTWYEIARFPNRFQKDCEQATASYSLREDGKVDVLNTCVSTSDGSKEEAHGVAQVEDKSMSAKLRVTFLPSWLRWTGVGKGDYWIIDLGPNYEYSVVSEPKREYLWILSRAPMLPQATYDKILARLREQGFDLSRLIRSRIPERELKPAS